MSIFQPSVESFFEWDVFYVRSARYPFICFLTSGLLFPRSVYSY